MDNEFRCPNCKFSTSQKTTLDAHLLTTHIEQSLKREGAGQDKKYSCDQCGYKAACSSCMKLHLKAVHFKIKDISCPYCEHTASQKSDMKKHIQARHLKDKEKKSQNHSVIQKQEGSLDNQPYQA